MDGNPWEAVLAAQDRPPTARQRRAQIAWVTTIVVAAVVLVGWNWLPTRTAPTIVYPVAEESVRVNVSDVVDRLAPTFWGANVGVNLPLTNADAAWVNATPITLVRWPGGSSADAINYTTGEIRYDGGTTGLIAENLSAFVGWCRSIDCAAILQLPGEIDDPATAAYDVAYTETTLGFHPTYWEIGDEPSRWTHFGVPWSAWNLSQAQNASPLGYANEVHAYIAAIHQVDPSAAIIGLPGVGTGVYGEATWITATVAVNGPNLSGVSVHVYPGGTPPNGTASLAQFVTNMTGARSLEGRVPADRAAIANACATCGPIPLLVTEFGSGIQGGSFDPFIDGFPQVPYVAGELVQAMHLNLTSADLFDVRSQHQGAWSNASLVDRPLYDLYATLLPHLGTAVLDSSVSGTVPGFYAVATALETPGAVAMLLVNGNITTSVAIDLAASGFPVANLTGVWSWDASTGAPVYTALAGGPANWTLMPDSVLLVTTGPTPPASTGYAPALASGASPGSIETRLARSAL
jgi:hypothetical protein